MGEGIEGLHHGLQSNYLSADFVVFSLPGAAIHIICIRAIPRVWCHCTCTAEGMSISSPPHQTRHTPHCTSAGNLWARAMMSALWKLCSQSVLVYMGFRAREYRRSLTPYEMIYSDWWPMISGDTWGLSFPDICLTVEGKPRKHQNQENWPDRGSNPGPLGIVSRETPFGHLWSNLWSHTLWSNLSANCRVLLIRIIDKT